MIRTLSSTYERTVYCIPAQCTLGDGSDLYQNTDPIVWQGWQGKFQHKGMRPPEFYYPEGPYTINGVKIAEGEGCRAIGLTGYNSIQSQLSGGSFGVVTGSTGAAFNSACLIVFGQLGNSGTPIVDTTPNHRVMELQQFSESSSSVVYSAHPATPPPLTASGISNTFYGHCYLCNSCCDIKYMIIDGEFPPDMILNMDTGRAYGYISEMDLPDDPNLPQSGKDYFLEKYRLPTNYRINEQNYATVGSAAEFGSATASYTIRAFNAKDPRVFTDKKYYMTIRNNWSSDRDRLIINIKNTFYLDGKPVENTKYLQGMKEKGYFQPH